MESSQIPTQEQVLADLGDHFVSSIVGAVDGARDDYESLRLWRPSWAVTYTSRFIANFAHERIWARLVTEVDGREGVTIRDHEPHREIRAGATYVTRIKRHHENDRISAFATPGSLAHWSNRGIMLDGSTEWSLAVGYYWDKELGEIGDAVLSLRESTEKAVWGVSLHRSEAQPTQIVPRHMEPGLPEFDLSEIASQSGEEGLA